MTIKTKYNIGDRIWIVYEVNTGRGLTGEVSVYDDVIKEISCNNESGIYYMTEYAYQDIKEKDIILYDDKEKLLNAIIDKMQEIHYREKEKE